jgi:hypothetical protein
MLLLISHYYGMWEVVTLAGEGRNTEVSCCCGSLTMKRRNSVISDLKRANLDNSAMQNDYCTNRHNAERP